MSVFGYGIFFLLLGGMLWRTAFRWRKLAESYAGTNDQVLEKRHMQNAVLMTSNGFNSLRGIVTIATHTNGVSLRLLPPFSLFHDPLFIPYSDISGWKTTWYLDAPSTELTFRRVPEIKMIVPAEQAEWMRSHAGRKMVLRDVPPPQGNTGRFWHAFSLAHAGISLGMVVVVLFLMLTRTQS